MGEGGNLARRDFIKAIGAGALAGCAIARSRAAAAPASQRARPNIVMIVADDQRYDTIGALGNPHIHTPNIDSLVRSGFSFTNARCMGSQVGAVCVPSRGCLHTGRMLFQAPEDLGAFDTLGQVLLNAGYDSFISGKWHNHPSSLVRSFNGGGNIFFGWMPMTQFAVPVSDYSPRGDYPGKSTIIRDRFSSALFTDPVVDFIQGRKGSDRPYFCYLAFISPHDPRTPPAPYRDLYHPADMPLPANFMPVHPFDNGELKIRDELTAPFPRTPDNTRRQLCDYYGMVSANDAQVGRVLTALKDSNQFDNTIVIYAGDHGLAIGSHGLFGKQNVYEHSARIPLVMSGPAVGPGKASDALVYGFDLFPTLCEMTGTASPGSVQGKSLCRIIAGREKAVRDSAFHAYIHQNQNAAADTQHAVLDGRWKMIRYRVKGDQRVQLFDLQNDPAEMHDLSSDPLAAKELPRLRKLLARWQTEVNDPFA